MKIVPKNWKDFQHYKDRDPTWIKLHKKLLDDYEFQCLPVASRALAPMLWLLASECTEGVIDANPKKLCFRLRTTEQDFIDALKPLIDGGFFEVAEPDSTPLAECKRDAMPEKKEEKQVQIQEKTEKTRALRAEFEDQFWPICPRKVGKGKALKAFAKARGSTDLETLLNAMARYRTSRIGQDENYTAHPATWLNDERWNDEESKNGNGNWNGHSKPSALDNALRGIALAADLAGPGTGDEGADRGAPRQIGGPVLDAGHVAGADEMEIPDFLRRPARVQ